MSIPSVGGRSISYDPHSFRESNQTVAGVQHALNRINQNTNLPENGVFDRDTENAVREFQNTHHLPETGVIDGETIDALNTQFDQTAHEEAIDAGTPRLSDEERGRRIQEMRIQEPVIRQDLETNAAGSQIHSSGVQMPYEFTPVERGHEQYNTAAEALNDPNPHNVNVRGHDYRICGATENEARVIRNTLERLPASHLDRIPPEITVSHTLSNNRSRGGAQFPDDAQHPRLELSRESLNDASANVASGQNVNAVSSTMLHETGHLVGSGMYGNHPEAYRSAPFGALQDLPAVVPENAQDPESRRRIEQYAQAYMMYFGGSDTGHPSGLSAEQRAAMRDHFQRAGIPAAD